MYTKPRSPYKDKDAHRTDPHQDTRTWAEDNLTFIYVIVEAVPHVHIGQTVNEIKAQLSQYLALFPSKYLLLLQYGKCFPISFSAMLISGLPTLSVISLRWLCSCVITLPKVILAHSNCQEREREFYFLCQHWWEKNHFFRAHLWCTKVLKITLNGKFLL